MISIFIKHFRWDKNKRRLTISSEELWKYGAITYNDNLIEVLGETRNIRFILRENFYDENKIYIGQIYWPCIDTGERYLALEELPLELEYIHLLVAW